MQTNLNSNPLYFLNYEPTNNNTDNKELNNVDREKIPAPLEEFQGIHEKIQKSDLKESKSLRKNDLASIVETLKELAKQDIELVAKTISNSLIDENTPEGQAALIEIAKFIAQIDGATTSLYIQNFKINRKKPEGKLALFEIAKLSAQTHGGLTSYYIQNYNIDWTTEEGQDALIEIAKIAAQQDGAGTAAYFQYYKIDSTTSKGQAALIEIAKLIAQQDGAGISLFIQNFNIHKNTPVGMQSLIEIAKLAAQQNGEGTSKYIQYYQIDYRTKQGQEALIEIAKLSAKQDGKGTSKYIHNYKINDKTVQGQAALFSIAKLSAQQNARGTLKYLANYKIRSEDDLTNICVTAVCSIRNQFLHLQKPASSELFKHYPLKKVLLFAQGEKNSDIIQQVLDEVECFAKKQPYTYLLNVHTAVKEYLKKLNPEKLSQKDIHKIKLNLTSWLAFAAAQLSREKIDPSWLLEAEELLRATIQVQDPTLRNRTLDYLAQNMAYTSDSYKAMKPSRLNPFNLLVCLFITEFCRGHDSQSMQRVAHFFYKLKSESKTPFLKDAGFAKKLLNVLDILIKDTILTFEEKQALLEKITSSVSINKEMLTSTLSAINGLFELQEQSRLKSILSTKEDAHLILIETYKNALKDVYQIIPFNEKPPTYKLEAFSNQLRDPNSILKYAAKMKLVKKNKDVLLKAIADCIENVINGRFPSSRYKDSIHLDKIFKNSPHLKEGWVKGEVLSLEQLFQQSSLDQKQTQVFQSLSSEHNELTIVDTDDFNDLLLCGTEVKGSCQGIEEKPEDNKCLLAYVIDGKNRLLAIKYPDGKIRARAILRLLFDEQAEKPVLFLEKIYPNNLELNEKKAIEIMASRKAKSLNLELLSQKEGNGERYLNTIVSFGGPAPFEYADSSKGVCENSKFSIENSHRLT